MLILTRRVTESLKIEDEVTVTILGIKGNQMRPAFGKKSTTGSKENKVVMKTRTSKHGAPALRVLKIALSAPILLFLKILEPVVTLVFSGLALLGLLTTFFFRAIGAPHFPFWTMIVMSLGFGAVVIAYQAVVRLLEV